MSYIAYKLLRSKRKTLALIIDSDGQLVVRAPIKLREELIRDFILKKAHWIDEKQSQVRLSKSILPPFVLQNGKTLLYLGKTHGIIRGDSEEIIIQGTSLLVPEKMRQEGFVAWLKWQAETLISQRAEYYAGLMGVEFSSLRISEARRRWGSCGAKNSLNFAWRLVMCPPTVIDYVIVHELSHITYKDHSRRFWERVESFKPDYKESQSWLKLNCGIMDII